MIWASILANAAFLVESIQTCDHFVNASINNIKYLNGPQGGCIGPQISPWILSKKYGDSIPIFDGDGNYDRNLMIWVRILANEASLVESRQTCDHLVYASTKTIKYLKGSQGGCTGPQISPWILSKKDKDSILIFYGDGLINNFP